MPGQGPGNTPGFVSNYLDAYFVANKAARLKWALKLDFIK
jgi:hypothetical protein